MTTTELNQVFLVLALALAVMMSASSPRVQSFSLQPAFERAGAILNMDLCPGGGALSCVLQLP